MTETIAQLVQLMHTHGAVRFYAKKLAPNDNSKNQIYLGGDFSALNIIPYRAIETDSSDLAGSRRERAKAPVSFSWVDADGLYPAPDAQLILYPKYPEVRMSGFLRGCKQAPSEVMRVRDEGRVLFLGITRSGEVLGYAVMAQHPLAQELEAQQGWESTGVFTEIPPDASKTHDTKAQLLEALTHIYRKHWIMSQKMQADGTIQPYDARNAGGYTLEAELGIAPNGYAEPDYLGWEVKQYSVHNFQDFRAKTPVTLMTPEPTGGLYKDKGVTDFMHRFGYADKSGKPDRINFGGIYSCDKPHHQDTGLQLSIQGYDGQSGKITDMEGGIVLLSRQKEVAALWGFPAMLKHWNRKHAQAAYVPSLFREPPPEYAYGAQILLCEQTDFTLFLQAVAAGRVYYDPAIKMEYASGDSPRIKRRSQFRVKHSHLTCMYHRHERVMLEAYA